MLTKDMHALLFQFCTLDSVLQTFESLYGPECCTPNMHMVCQLKQCLVDFGPLSSFWCFLFECNNRILEGVNKSWVSLEKQIFMKFLGMQHMKQLSISVISEGDFVAAVYEQLRSKIKDDTSSFGQTQVHELVIKEQIRNFSCETSMLDGLRRDYQYLSPTVKGEVPYRC